MHIKLSATFASNVYEAEQTPVKGFKIKTYSNGNIQWLTAMRGNDLWVAFAGTNEIKDWLENLDARKIQTPHGRFHAGFYNAACDVEEHVHNSVDYYGLENLTFCGHSLGGAIAAIMATKCKYLSQQSKLFLTTFGQPRVGDAKWAASVFKDNPNNYVRVVNVGDPVPHLPTLFRFRHGGQVRFFDHEKMIVNPTFSQRVGAVFNNLVQSKEEKRVFLHSHSMKNYLKNVLRMSERRTNKLMDF